MTDKMSIDDLIALLEEERAGYEKSNKAEIVRNWGTGIKLAIRVIEDNRDALAGTRGVLRFRKNEYGYWREIDLEGEWLHEDTGGDVHYYDKQAAINDCERRGLDAEFEPAEPEETK